MSVMVHHPVVYHLIDRPAVHGFPFALVQSENEPGLLGCDLRDGADGQRCDLFGFLRVHGHALPVSA
jgi:hypothetical protein